MEILMQNVWRGKMFVCCVLYVGFEIRQHSGKDIYRDIAYIYIDIYR